MPAAAWALYTKPKGLPTGRRVAPEIPTQQRARFPASNASSGKRVPLALNPSTSHTIHALSRRFVKRRRPEFPGQELSKGQTLVHAAPRHLHAGQKLSHATQKLPTRSNRPRQGMVHRDHQAPQHFLTDRGQVKILGTSASERIEPDRAATQNATGITENQSNQHQLTSNRRTRGHACIGSQQDLRPVGRRPAPIFPPGLRS